MILTMDLGYDKFNSEGDYDNHIVTSPSENKELTLSAFTVFKMLKALPKGVKWNPAKDCFEKDGEEIC